MNAMSGNEMRIVAGILEEECLGMFYVKRGDERVEEIEMGTD
jgi:hypothetical protein